MLNLEKELLATSKKARTQMSATAAVNQAQKLLMDKGQEDFELLKNIGMHQGIVRASENEERRLQLEKLNMEIGDVVTKDDIEKVAKKYALKFLRADNYRGNVDPVIPQRIREFTQAAGINLNAATAAYNFFILAPEENFELKDNIMIPRDPILFYHMGNRLYKLVHKWGGDLTPYRRFLGFYRSGFWQFLLTNIFISVLIMSLTIYGCWRLDNTYGKVEALWVFLSAGISVLCIAVTISKSMTRDGFVYKWWDDLWDSEYKWATGKV